MPNYERNIRLILFLILPILGFLLGWSLSQKNSGQPAMTVRIEEPKGEEVIEIPQVKPKKRNIKPKNVDLDIFWETWNSMEENFLHNEKLNVREQVYGATKGLISSLNDPYTVFMTPEDTKKFDESISGEFEGIGAEIAIRNDQLVVVAPLKGSPAELAGLRAGDIVFKIDDEPTTGISVEKAVTRIRGPKGQKVVLTVLRNEKKTPIEVTIVRDNIVIKSIEWKMKDDIAVVTVSQFGTEMTREFQEAIPEILLQNPRGMILDFRNDGGGLLDACVKLSSEFLDRKVIVRTKGRNFGDSGEIMSGNSGAFLGMPLVVLINKGSASASEIFAGAIQDHYRGVILGEKSFGKGSVQNVIPLSDGSSLKVTIAEWLTPGGKSINEVGIEPDEEIKITEEDFIEGRDPVIDRALDLVGTDEARDILEGKKKAIEEGEKTMENVE